MYQKELSRVLRLLLFILIVAAICGVAAITTNSRVHAAGTQPTWAFPFPTGTSVNIGPLGLHDHNFGSMQDDRRRITPNGTITEFPLPDGGSNPNYITTGPNGNLWFTASGVNKIGEMTPSGSITEFPVPTSNSDPRGITSGSDGNLWFTEVNGNKIGKITP